MSCISSVCYMVINGSHEIGLFVSERELYEKESSQVVNFQKSSISFSSNTCHDQVVEICNALHVTHKEDYGSYFGLPSHVGRNHRAVFDFVKDRIWKSLQGWKRILLSRVRKEVLLKSVVQSIPTYVMSVFKLSNDIISNIEKIMNSF
ncbi:hypothetical protein P3X46_030871 [Hevea brasiliensis]|uniref:Uncharacterized protein n=1 Tax=Hevea brasiliensis TaxID=3981 RepID=A0ABQ9KK16_HEVBR|nr:hypothetical protein P3X46_030871 [Hevea brasiliensis]